MSTVLIHVKLLAYILKIYYLDAHIFFVPIFSSCAYFLRADTRTHIHKEYIHKY